MRGELSHVLAQMNPVCPEVQFARGEGHAVAAGPAVRHALRYIGHGHTGENQYQSRRHGCRGPRPWAVYPGHVPPRRSRGLDPQLTCRVVGPHYMRRSNNPFGAYLAGSGLDTRFVAFLPVASKKSWRSEGNMLTVVARYVVSEGHDSTVARLLRKNAEASRNEPGCLEFSVYQEIDDP